MGVRDAESRMGSKVVGILLEGEKYEPADGGSSNSLRARSNREEAGVRQRSGESSGRNKKDGMYPCAGLLRLFAPLFRCAL